MVLYGIILVSRLPEFPPPVTFSFRGATPSTLHERISHVETIDLTVGDTNPPNSNPFFIR